MRGRAELAAIFVGGAIGSALRAWVGTALTHDPGAWPWATFIVNLAGALTLGYVVTRLGDRPPSPYGRPLLGTGFCGGLTTFSTMQLELLQMLDAGHVGLAALYAATSVAAGYACVQLATGLAR